MLLEYDGSGFNGFQKQKKAGLVTVQNELERALKRLLGEDVKTHAAGRTDTGVHALGQVVSFRTGSAHEVSVIGRALNALLPDCISIREATEEDPAFHARFSARFRIYHYYILNRKTPSALCRNFVYHLKKPLDLGKMRQASSHLIGSHDFTSFCSAVKEVEQTQRCVSHIRIFRPGESEYEAEPLTWGGHISRDLVVCEFKANSFLHSMVRLIMAVLIRVGEGKMSPSEVLQILLRRRPGLMSTKVPSHALFLMQVVY